MCSTLINLGQVFLNRFRFFNKHLKGSVIQSGFLSRLFNIERGCRHDNPIAAYMFLLCAQITLLMVDNNKSITEISIKKHSCKITQFADDTTIFLDGSRDSLIATLNTRNIWLSIWIQSEYR